MRTPGELEAARRAIRRYGRSLGVDLSFQQFDREVRELPGEYAPPMGDLWVAWSGRRAVGVVAIRSLGRRRAELKRLYVSPGARGRGLGRRLTRCAARRARRSGYRWIYLDTLATMTAAIRLYEELGFRPTRSYRYNPLPGSRFFRLRLSGSRSGRRTRPTSRRSGGPRKRAGLRRRGAVRRSSPRPRPGP